MLQFDAACLLVRRCGDIAHNVGHTRCTATMTLVIALPGFSVSGKSRGRAV
jgi:hypothetical protein